MSGARERVEAALATAVRRLFLRGLVEGAGWALLALLLALELALALASHAPGLAAALLAAGAAGASFAVVRAAGKRPGPAVAARVLDAGLGGAALATAHEALEGAHPRFAGLVLDEAAQRLQARALPALVPLRAPAGLFLAAAALALLPALLLAPGTTARAGEAAPPAPPSLLSARALAGGDLAAPEGEPETTPPAALVPVAVDGPLAGEDPLAAFPPELREVIRARLVALARALPPGAGGQPGGAAARPNGPEADLASALESGDAEALLQALERLAAAAKGGDRPAAARLDELARVVGPPGGGGSGEVATPPPAGGGPLPVVEPAGPGGGRVQGLPRQLQAAVERYFERSR